MRPQGKEPQSPASGDGCSALARGEKGKHPTPACSVRRDTQRPLSSWSLTPCAGGGYVRSAPASGPVSCGAASGLPFGLRTCTRRLDTMVAVTSTSSKPRSRRTSATSLSASSLPHLPSTARRASRCSSKVIAPSLANDPQVGRVRYLYDALPRLLSSAPIGVRERQL
jgi:hypothetical protein